MVPDDLLGKHQVSLKQGLSGAFHRDSGHPTHLSELLGQRRKLLVVGGAHLVSLRAELAEGRKRKIEFAVNGCHSQVTSAPLVTVRSSGSLVGVLLPV